tara:strand:- start:1995 stop:2678 length:684 start_codon:yes stop_codon:yes gene_type:complete
MLNISNNILQKIFAILLSIAISPLFILVGVLVLCFSGRPIIYTQERYGKNFNKFKILKFRTMKLNNSDAITDYNDIRITKIGYLLRACKLDELPQLINIIRGDMCFIGPRPELIKIIDQKKDLFAFLFKIKPGITDISSIIFKNESEIFRTIPMIHYESIILPIKIQLIKIHTDKRSRINDFLIIILTLFSFFNHNLTMLIIKKIYLNDIDIEFRTKLNNVLSKQIF